MVRPLGGLEKVRIESTIRSDPDTPYGQDRWSAAAASSAAATA
jgi:hypothetical protein